ncbi:uridine kinase family protein [Pseudactinotalea sp. Z1739]|uniref:uridine kinase family protein n=1 Tax=Pseudactinotalea sp. Z1739 TaxID=3413028 RepID=UPI003C7A75DB
MSATDAALEVITSRIRHAPARLGPGEDGLTLVCIDGPAGSGKTTLATRLSRRTGAHVVHMDDLYEGWSGLLGVSTRLHEQILVPMAAGEQGRYQRYDWHRGEFAEWVAVPRTPVLILEGCGAGSAVVQPHLGLLIWVSAPDDLRLRRGLERDGTQSEGHWRAFMADEQVLYARERTAERAHLRLDSWGRLDE